MSFLTATISPLLRVCIAGTSRTCLARYSVGKKLVAEKEDESFVEEDAEKLCKYVCINYLTTVEGEGPEIKANSEYPEWLFNFDLKPKRELEDMDPEIDGWNYWLEYKNRQNKERERFEFLKYRHLSLQNSPSSAKQKLYSRYKCVNL